MPPGRFHADGLLVLRNLNSAGDTDRGSDGGSSDDGAERGEQGDPVDSAPLPPALRENPDHAGAGEQGDRANGGTSLRSEPVYRASAPSMSEVRTWCSKEAAPPPPPDSKTYYLCALQGPSEAVQ